METVWLGVAVLVSLVLMLGLFLGYVLLLNLIVRLPAWPSSAPDLIDWDLLESVDAKLARWLESQTDTAEHTPLCENCDDAGFGECLQPTECPLDPNSTPLPEGFDRSSVSDEWTPAEAATEPSYVCGVADCPIHKTPNTYAPVCGGTVTLPSDYSITINPEMMPPASWAKVAATAPCPDFGTVTTFGGTVLPSPIKGGPASGPEMKRAVDPAPTLTDEEWERYLNTPIVSSREKLRLVRAEEDKPHHRSDGGELGGQG